MAPLLEIKNLTCRRDEGSGSSIFHDLSLEVEEGEVLIITGRSGCGKTTLLKCVAELDVYQTGDILLRGKKATEYGIPTYRTLVQYVPQRPSLLPGTPLDFLHTIRSFRSRQARARSTRPSDSHASDGDYGAVRGSESIDPLELAAEWGIEKTMWKREWGTLSGGEGQRIALAVAVGVGGAEVVLLDEPTSALDAATMKTVEKSLVSMLPPLKTQHSGRGGGVERKGTGPKALLWITHEAAQAERVGTRTVDLTRQ
ncbi:hypothetical protein JCM24511_09567 [Saitozyma sp. JCM 24511]|nr:hypothetical protein JCM24511_09567 [Saitozyma sp. JCM 24511]